MSCDSENSCSSSSSGVSLFKLLFLLVLAVFLIGSYKEILRYIRISTM